MHSGRSPGLSFAKVEKLMENNTENIENNTETIENTPAQKKKTGKLLYIVLVISIAAVLVFAFNLGREIYTNRQSRKYYADLTVNIQTRPRSQAPNPSTPAAGEPERDIDDINAEPPQNADEDEYEWLPYVDFAGLNDQFPGISAWIQLEGTVLDYPIMLWADNDYFLNHLSDGTNHRSGSIFLDYRNNADFSDKNTLLYGHASRTDDMFGLLKYYRDQTFYEEHPIMYIYTPDRDYELVLFAGYLLDSGYETPPLIFKGEDAYSAHLADIIRRSVFRSNVEVDANDRIVSLCTCAYDFTNARLIIVGKLVEMS